MLGTARAAAWVAFLAPALGGFGGTNSAAHSPPESSPDFGPLEGEFFGGGDGPLVVMLHGDLSNNGTVDYMYQAAKEIVNDNPGSSVGVIFRPGYCDTKGKKRRCSKDTHGHGKWDHYSAGNIDLVEAAIRSLKHSTGAETVIGIGHSGGAAMLGVILGKYRGLIDKAILVACPCDVRAWNPDWKRSEDPIEYVSYIPTDTPIVLVHGTHDPNVHYELSRVYARAVLKVRDAKTKCLTDRRVRCGVKVVLYPRADHSFNDIRCEILEELNLLMPKRNPRGRSD